MSHIEHLRSGVSGTFISETLVQRGLYHLNLEKLDDGDRGLQRQTQIYS